MAETRFKSVSRFPARASKLEVGEGVVDTTPPLGIELAGFHRPDEDKRVVTGIRQKTAARALFMHKDDVAYVIVSLDIAAVSKAFAERVQKRIEQTVGVPAANVRIVATHTHSMPSLRFLRQWGAIPKEYMASLETKITRAVGLAKEDLAPADVYVGKARVQGGNFNRTTKIWKTDAAFTRTSTDQERWLDTMLHVLHFLRAKPHRELVWYHFSAHPVCYTDTLAGPDWPGLVHDALASRWGLKPAFLQGHAGDVNPGDGDPWIGDPDETVQAVYPALHHALSHAVPMHVNRLRLINDTVSLPLDIDLLEEQLTRYRKDPAACTKGEWVDAGFVADWAASAAKWDRGRRNLAVSVSAIRLGDFGILFHPSELYSYYGLAIQRGSSLPVTLELVTQTAWSAIFRIPRLFAIGSTPLSSYPRFSTFPRSSRRRRAS